MPIQAQNILYHRYRVYANTSLQGLPGSPKIAPSYTKINHCLPEDLLGYSRTDTIFVFRRSNFAHFFPKIIYGQTKIVSNNQNDLKFTYHTGNHYLIHQ